MDYEIRKTFNGELAENDTLKLQEGAEGTAWKLRGTVEMAIESAISDSEFTSGSDVTLGLASLTNCKVSGKCTATCGTLKECIMGGVAELADCELKNCTFDNKSKTTVTGEVDGRSYFYDCKFKAGSEIKSDENTVFVRCSFSNHSLLKQNNSVFIDCTGNQEAEEFAKEEGGYW